MPSDLRDAWRAHRAQPAFTIVAVLILAVGIGANTAVFSVANVVLLKALPYPDGGRLMALFEARPREQVEDNVVSIADFLDWREQNTVFSSIAAYEGTTYNLTGSGDPEQLFGAVATAHFFETLGVQPLLGRGFTAEDEQSGGSRVIVLSHGLWQRRFGGDRDVVGSTITLNGWPQTIIGIMPPGFVPPIRVWELFGPIRFNAESRNLRGNHSLSVVARLKPEISLEQARQEMDVISKRLEASQPLNQGHYAHVVPLDQAMRGRLRPAMRVLLAAVGLVLLIACFNVANLLLARSVTRAREISVRLALGASPGRIIRQLLAESTLLSVSGAAACVLAAFWGVEYLGGLIPQELGLAREDIRVDTPVLIFAVGIAVLSGLISGLAPAFSASRASINEVLRSGGFQQTSSPWKQRQRAAIVAAETALSVLLLVGAGLLVRSFLKVAEVDPGFRAEKVLTMGVALPYSTYSDDAKKTAFQRDLLQNVGRLPGVVRAGITSFLPVSGQNSRMGLVIEGVEPDPNDDPRRANWRIVTPGYFETMQIPLLQGRLFNESDQKGTRPVMIINETAAKKYWPGRDPIGTNARLSGMEPWSVVVGVVGDVKHWGLEEPARPEAYLSLWQSPFFLNNLVVRTQGDPMLLAQGVRRELAALDKDLPPASIRSLEDVIGESTALRKFYMLLLTGLAAIAMLLAAAGLYSQIAYSVSQRVREIGLRMVLGARRSDVIGMVVREGLTVALAGASLGIAAAFALTRLLEGLLFGVEPLDPAALAMAPLMLLAVAVVACLIPSWRASKTEPAAALRSE